jgi:hypothetical protein
MKIKKILPFVLSLLLLLGVAFPSTTYAQGGANCPLGYTETNGVCIVPSSPTAAPNAKICNATGTDIGDVICKIGSLLKSIIPLLVALGVVYFVYGVVTYVIGGDGESKKEGRERIMYGLIGFAVIVGFWGLVSIVVNFFGFTEAQLAVMNPATNFTINNPTPSTALGGCDAALGSDPKLQNTLSYITCIIGASVIPFIFALAAAAFLWGMVQFLILGGGQEEKRTQGKQMMLWGLIALTVMIGMWGIVKITGNTFGIGDSSFLPQVRP